MIKRVIAALLLLLVASVFAAEQSHPTSELATNVIERDADLDLGDHDIYLNTIYLSTIIASSGSNMISLLSTGSTLFGLTLGAGGFTCTTCIDTSDIGNNAVTSSKIASEAASFNKVSGGAASSDGTNLQINNNNACIKNAAGNCKITFDANGNVIINV